MPTMTSLVDIRLYLIPVLLLNMMIVSKLSAASLPAAPKIMVASSQWRLDQQPDGCRLLRSFGSGDDEITLQIKRSDSPMTSEVIILGKKFRSIKQVASIKMSLAPPSIEIDYDAQMIRVAGESGRAIMWRVNDANYWPNMATNQDIVIFIDNTNIVQLKTSNAKPAIAALQNCHDSLFKIWGFDAVALRSLKSLPSPSGSRPWVSHEDYPAEAWTREIQGDTTIGLIVGKDGLVTTCKVLVSAGHNSLDSKSCSEVSKNARFLPALTQEGSATEAPYITTIRWFLPK
jgi:TonB family protein